MDLEGTLGVRLRGDAADAGTLALLVEACPELAEQQWTCLADGASRASVLVSVGLDASAAGVLIRRGLDVVRVTLQVEGGLVNATIQPILPRTPGAEDAAAEDAVVSWPGVAITQGEQLVTSLRPLGVPGDPVVDEALFVMRRDSPAPQGLLERLLLLGREDAMVVELRPEGGGDASLCVRVKQPPLYLLMRARDGDADDTVVYARAGRAPLWIEWGFEHPLPRIAAAALARLDRSALVDATGRWRLLPAESAWIARSVHDVIAPEMLATRERLEPTSSELRFTIFLRLAAGTPIDPELWLLSQEEFIGLEEFIEAASSDELGRVSVARLAGREEVVYLLRERVRPGVSRVGPRLSEYLGAPGYARAPGSDNLFLPVARRLVPAVRRDELRRLLSLDQAHVVVITEDADGPRIVTIGEVDETPLTRWIEYVSTDRRLELDRVLEASVFDFPGVNIEWPKVVERTVLPPQRLEGGARRRRNRRRVESAAPIEEAIEEAIDAVIQETPEAERLKRLRQQARELEERIADGGVQEPPTWRELGELKRELGEHDEAAACFEQSCFHAGLPRAAGLVGLVARTHAELASVPHSGEAAAELAIKDARTPNELAYLGGALMDALVGPVELPEDVIQYALPLFADPRAPVSRRLAWSVLSTWYHRAGDSLGMTRAKEAVLGGINERGLSELYDLPSFVRYALVREDDEDEGGASEDRIQRAQSGVLQAMWRELEARAIEDFDVLSCFTRLMFGIGFLRLGERQTARELVEPVEEELDVHDPPNRALYRLYLARMAHDASGGSEDAWAHEVSKIVSGLKDKTVKRAVESLRRRSSWLSVPGDAEQPPRVRTEVERAVARVEKDLGELRSVVEQLMTARGRFYDYEVVVALERIYRLALRSGSERLVAEFVERAARHVGAIQILSHRAQALGVCLQGASLIEHEELASQLLEELVEVARDRELGSVRDLLLAVKPALAALRRFGSLDTAGRLLAALEGVRTYSESGDIRLRAEVAAGYLQQGDPRRADTLIDVCLRSVLEHDLDYVGRYEAGAGVADALRRWPNVGRLERCQRLLGSLERFRDTFTTSRYFARHKVLMIERLVDSVADSQTRHSDRIQAYLDGEEHILRRRIIQDWSLLCGP